MTDLMKLFAAKVAYIDEDGYLSFNPKHMKDVGVVLLSKIESNQECHNIYDVQGDHYQYAGYQNYTVKYEISIIPAFLNNLEVAGIETKKIETKEIDKVQEEFMFLDTKEIDKVQEEFMFLDTKED